MKKRIISLLVSAILLIGLIPAYAQETISVFDGVSHEAVSKISGLKHDGEGIGSTASGYARFDNIDFGNTGISSFLVNISVPDNYAGQTVYFYVGSINSNPFAELKVSSTGGWNNYQWQEATLKSEDVYGVNTVYLTMGSSGVGNLTDFKATPAALVTDLDIPQTVIDAGMEDIFSVLTALDIIEYNEGDTFDATAQLTAADFAKAALMLRGETGDTAVNNLLSACEISATTRITTQKACQMLINMLNRQTTVFEGISYYEMANELDIKCTKAPEEVITWTDAMNLLYDASETAPLEISSVTHDNNGIVGSYTAKNDNTILAEYRKIGKLKGIVTMDSFTGLKDVSDISEGQVVIDNYILNVGECDVSEFLGYEVEYYFQANTYDDTLLHIKKTKNNQVTNLSVSEIENYSDGVLTYYDGDKEKTLRISNDISVIYNGIVVSKYDDSMFNMKNGSLEIISNNRDDIPDVVKIWDTDDYQFSGYSNGVIYFKNSTDTINLKDPNIQYVMKKNSGKLVEPEELLDDSVLTVAKVQSINASYTFYTIWVSTGVVYGKVNSVDTDSALATINGEEVKISKAFMDAGRVGLFTGAEIKGYLNKYSEIAFVAGNAVSDKLGYIARCYQDETTDDVYVRIFDEDGKMADYKCYEKIRIDGIIANDPYALLQNTNTLCIFETNNSGEVRKITFAKDKSSNDANNGLYHYGQIGATFRPEASSLGGKYILSESFILFKVPTDKTEYDKYVVTATKPSYEPVSMSLYNRETGKLDIDIGVQDYDPEASNPDDGGDIKFVNKVWEEWTGEYATAFIEYYDGKNQTLLTKQVVEWKKDAALALLPGDAIRIKISSDDKIEGLETAFSVQNSPVPSGLGGQFDIEIRMVGGNIAKKVKNIIQLETADEVFNCASAVVYVFEDNEVRPGSLQEALSSETIATGNKVWMAMYRGTVKTIVIVK